MKRPGASSGTYCQKANSLKSPLFASSRKASALHRPACSIFWAMAMAVVPSGKVRRVVSAAA